VACGQDHVVLTAVVIPAHNAEDHLADALRSVWAQTRPPAEVVVVDDGSTDATAQIAADLGARTVTQPNSGPAAARNRGRRELSPEIDYALFLDADDVVEPQMIEVLEDHLDAHPDAGLVYCGLQLIGDDGRLKGNRGSWPPRHDGGRFGRPRLVPDDEPATPMVSILDFVAIIPSVSLFRLSALDRAGGWIERFPGGGADTAVVVEVALHSAVHFVPRDLVRYRSHSGQVSGNVERVVHRQRQLHGRLRRRGEPQLVEAWKIYDRQLLTHRSYAGVQRALRARHLVEALRIAAGTGRVLVRSYVPWPHNELHSRRWRGHKRQP
jgi:glycosyltransferase involved in cell wall biosynthesis